MPVDPTKFHTFSVRRPKSDLPRLRELARLLSKSTAKLIVEAIDAGLPVVLERERARRKVQ